MNIEAAEKIPFPDSGLLENFEFECSTTYGNFTFKFKWFDNRWNLWVTQPEGLTKQAGVYPNIMNWTGDSKYGLIFKTSLTVIDFESLFMTELYLVKWK